MDAGMGRALTAFQSFGKTLFVRDRAANTAVVEVAAGRHSDFDSFQNSDAVFKGRGLLMRWSVIGLVIRRGDERGCARPGAIRRCA
jgi:hypothetical protein